MLVTDPNTPPSGLPPHRQQGAGRSPPPIRRVKAELRRHPKAIPYEYTKGPPTWQVSWFSNTKPQRELLQVYVDDNTGAVTQAWTGFQVAWTMARGYPGAFGRRVNSWYIWVPLCILFVAPFLPWRRPPRRVAPGPAGAAQLLDLAGVLQPRQDRALGPARLSAAHLPDAPPVLLGQRPRHSASGRCARWSPTSWLAIGTVFLMAFRIGLNILNSNVIDVGYSGVIGADKLIHNVALYGHWPKTTCTATPTGRSATCSTSRSGSSSAGAARWDSLPAAHGAAIFFDLLCVAGLYLLGRRLRGNRWAWCSPTAGPRTRSPSTR